VRQAAARQMPLVFVRAHEEAFRTWLSDNPEVWRLFERFALEVIKAGHDHYSADAICHRIRWEVDVETRGDQFKINNNHVAFLAREFERRHPRHVGLFRTRVQKVAL
jgi:hypothetical protein